MCKELSRNLKTAIHFNDIKKVKKLLKSSSVKKPLSKDPFIFGGHNLLKLAIGLRKKKIAILLIKKGAQINDKYNRSFSPLHLAANQTYADLVELLISKNADVNNDLKKKSPPLMFTFFMMRTQHLRPISKIVKCLLNNSYNPEAKLSEFTDVNEIELQLACDHLSFEHIRLLLKHRATVKSKIFFDPQLISDTVLWNSYKCTKLFLQYGAQATTIISDKFLEDIERYLELGARIKSFGQPSLLHVAIAYKNKKMVELLIDYGADINYRTQFLQRTPLMLAIEECEPEIVDLLLKKGARIDVFDENGISLVHYVIRNPKNMNEPLDIEPEEVENQRGAIFCSLMNAGANFNEALKPIGDKLTFFTSAATYGQSLLIQHLTCEECLLDVSLLDYNIFQSIKLNLNLLSQEQRDDEEFMEDIQEIFKKIEFEMVCAVLKAYYIEEPIDKTMLEAIRSKPVNDFIAHNKYIDFIVKGESRLSALVQSMKEHNIGTSNFTVWNLLTFSSHRIAKYFRNKNVQQICTDEYLMKFECGYYYKLKLRKDAAIQRLELLEKTTEIAFIILKFLPFMCCEDILNYFSNDELKVFYNQFKAIL